MYGQGPLRLVIAVMWVLALTAPLNAAELLITPGINTDFAYDDNVFFEDVDDFTWTLSPRFRLEHITRRTRTQLETVLTHVRYFDNSDLNRLDQRYQLSTSVSAARPLSIQFGGGFSRSESVDLVLETEGRLVDRSTQDAYNAFSSLNFILSPRDSVSLTGSFSYTTQDDPSLFENTAKSVSLAYTHSMARGRVSLTSSLGYTRSEAERDSNRDTSEEDIIRFFQSIGYSVTPAFFMQLGAGFSYRSLEQETEEVIAVPFLEAAPEAILGIAVGDGGEVLALLEI
jgi:uncharacterized protein (PEP-CTERM system associated)